MSDNKRVNHLLLPARFDSETIRKTVLTNITKMLRTRGYLDENKWTDGKIRVSVKESRDDNIYVIPLDKKMVNLKAKNFDGSKVYVKLITQKIKNTTNIPIITEFIRDYNAFHKILIFEDIHDKVARFLKSDGKIEIFKQNQQMINLVDHDLCPKCTVLTSDEKAELKNTYGIDANKMQKMFENDPLSLYFALKRGDVLKVRRDSVNTVYSVAYRVVI